MTMPRSRPPTQSEANPGQARKGLFWAIGQLRKETLARVVFVMAEIVALLALADLLLVIRNAAVPGWLQTVSAVVLTAIMCLYSVLVLGVDWEV